jgi:adenylate cyclase
MAPPKKQRNLTVFLWLILLPIPLLWCGLAHFGQLQFLENRLLDIRFRARGEISAPVKLIYVDLDTEGIELFGERPWTRSYFGAVTEAVFDLGGAKAVGFDFVFSKFGRSKLVDEAKVTQGNMTFGKVIRAHPKKVVLGVQYTAGTSGTQSEIREFPFIRKGKVDPKKNDVPEWPEPPFDHPAVQARFGLIDVDVEYSADEVPRWVPLFAYTQLPTLYHLSLQLVLLHYGLNEDAVHIERDQIKLVRPDGKIVLTIPLHQQQLLEANWFSHWENQTLNPRFSVAMVISAMEAMKSPDAAQRAQAKDFFANFKDALVLIGPVDPLLQDLAPTPFDAHPVPKVGLHGNLVKTMISQRFLHRPPDWVLWVSVFVLTLGVTVLAISGGARGLVAKIFAMLALAGYIVLAMLLFSRWEIVLPMAAPLGSAFTTSFLAIIWQLVTEQKQKGRIKGMFGAYVSPQLVEQMVESGDDPQLGGHDDEITAYFSDIQGFSSFSEKLGSGPLVELMNEYLTACTDIVQAQGGTLDKYIGDAVVAMFGAPIALSDHAYRACVASQLVHQKLGELRNKWKGEGTKWPEIVWKMQTRVGLNTGVCMIGNMGSRTRFNYTMMGDNVNLAARMESGSKSWGAYTMVTETTKAACERHGGDRVVFRPLGRIVVMGRSLPVPIYEIVGLKESLPPTARECIAVFEQGLAKYYARDWDGAIALFRQSEQLEPNQPGKTPGVKTNPSLVYIGIAEDYKLEPPPENWDGVYVMKEK